MNDMPTAVMSGASFGARRSRRYAKRSMPTLMPLQKAIETTRASNMMPKLRTLGSVALKRVVVTSADISVPSMKRSPWAKLMSWMMPYTIV